MYILSNIAKSLPIPPKNARSRRNHAIIGGKKGASESNLLDENAMQWWISENYQPSGNIFTK